MFTYLGFVVSLVLLVLKLGATLLGVVTGPWLLVAMPLLIGLGIDLTIFVLGVLLLVIRHSRTTKVRNESRRRGLYGLLLLLLIPLVGACTDAERSRYAAYGNAATIELYSGGQLIQTYRTTGKILSESGSDGYFFKDAETGESVEISGDVIITYDKYPR